MRKIKTKTHRPNPIARNINTGLNCSKVIPNKKKVIKSKKIKVEKEV